MEKEEEEVPTSWKDILLQLVKDDQCNFNRLSALINAYDLNLNEVESFLFETLSESVPNMVGKIALEYSRMITKMRRIHTDRKTEIKEASSFIERFIGEIILILPKYTTANAVRAGVTPFSVSRRYTIEKINVPSKQSDDLNTMLNIIWNKHANDNGRVVLSKKCKHCRVCKKPFHFLNGKKSGLDICICCLLRFIEYHYIGKVDTIRTGYEKDMQDFMAFMTEPKFGVQHEQVATKKRKHDQ